MYFTTVIHSRLRKEIIVNNLEHALERLNNLIDGGVEFPDACYRVSCEERVPYEDLADAYDAQFD